LRFKYFETNAGKLKFPVCHYSVSQIDSGVMFTFFDDLKIKDGFH